MYNSLFWSISPQDAVTQGGFLVDVSRRRYPKKKDYFFNGDLDAQKAIFESKYDADTLKKRKELIGSGKRIVNTDGPKQSCTNDYLFEKDLIVVPDNRKKSEDGATREVRVCVKCGRLNHSASRCKESGATKGKRGNHGK